MQVYSNELYHYGVIGMKWGVRRYQNPDGSLTNAGRRKYGGTEHITAKNEMKTANKQFNKSFNKAYNRSGLIFTKKQRQANDERWDKAYDDAAKYREAKSKYKIAKAKDKELARVAREELNSKTREVRKSDKGLKYFYNYKTSEYAAKKILDENYSYNDAVKSAKSQAWKNTASVLAIYGGLALGSVILAKKAGAI